MKIFTNVIASPVRAKQSIFGRLVFALVFAAFTACDSGSSSTDPDPIAEVSSSGGGDEVFSSSSVTDKGTSSGGSSRSSSSAIGKNSSSSVNSGSDTSSSDEGSSVKSSSSSLDPCKEEYEGREKISLDENRQRVEFVCHDGFWIPLAKSSSSEISSSSYYDMSKQYNENVEYGEFTDPRDGNVYRTITYAAKPYISSNIVAMASNLNYGEMVPVDSATNADGVVEKFCYNDDPWYCENGFDGLYSWSEAMNFHRACDTLFLGSSADCPNVFDEDNSERRQHQGICPEGWHVMNEFEWRRLPSTDFGCGKMLSKLFMGTDQVGFSALLGGGYYVGNYEGMGEYVPFWTPQEVSDTSKFAGSVFLTTFLNADKVEFRHRSYKQNKAAVRCVKDYIVE
ncbi:FISUMP domain-containing protein [Fibrobacter sp. UWH4]|uniref:FISUMP domain-containing protein n=1 Tax=Fibrobacter sp. UWH4 TaxID=1896210 RepID=UPI001114F806|nr:FISUMP domain-containing protein [Fibrobacter sp. UWH4]